jgi:hypothetical protein
MPEQVQYGYDDLDATSREIVDQVTLRKKEFAQQNSRMSALPIG